jgi:site-specific DNA-cytosine methylase
MKVLVACEFSGVVRDAFAARGHDAWSCDLLPSERAGQHLEGNVLDFLCLQWDLLIAFPPCTHLSVSGARWFGSKREEQRQALVFFYALLTDSCPRICIENPVGIVSTHIRKPTQVINPWQFGHGEAKRTCLWLKNLPRLQPTEIVAGREPRVHWAAPGPDRWKERSRTLPGIAAAMAEQWG